MTGQALTVPEVAKQIRVAPGKVRTWIDSGELVAANVASAGSSRPIWRIAADDLAAFLQSRSAVRQSAPTVTRRKRSKAYREFV